MQLTWGVKSKQTFTFLELISNTPLSQQMHQKTSHLKMVKIICRDDPMVISICPCCRYMWLTQINQQAGHFRFMQKIKIIMKLKFLNNTVYIKNKFKFYTVVKLVFYNVTSLWREFISLLINDRLTAVYWRKPSLVPVSAGCM